jgi:hypothetical protein
MLNDLISVERKVGIELALVFNGQNSRTAFDALSADTQKQIIDDLMMSDVSEDEAITVPGLRLTRGN